MNLESDSDEEDEVLQTTGIDTVKNVEAEVEKSGDYNPGTAYKPTPKMKAAEDSIQNNEWNIKAWETLFAEARSLSAEYMPEARKIYERFFEKISNVRPILEVLR